MGRNQDDADESVYDFFKRRLSEEVHVYVHEVNIFYTNKIT